MRLDIFSNDVHIVTMEIQDEPIVGEVIPVESTDCLVQPRMRRHLFEVRGCPPPYNSRPVLNILLMADMAIHLLMGALLPGFPSCLHNMAGTTKRRIVLHIVIETISAQDDSQAHQDQDRKKDLTKTEQGFPPARFLSLTAPFFPASRAGLPTGCR